MLTNLDEKILFELYKNSRISFRKLARKLRVSKDTVGTHVEKLVSFGYIHSFSSHFNLFEKDFKKVNFFIRLNNVSSIDSIIDFLIKRDNSLWVGKSFGIFDLKVTCVFQKLDEINTFISDLNSEFAGKINSVETSIITSTKKLDKLDFFNNLLGTNFKDNFFPKLDANKDLDLVDKRILFELSANSREKLTSISRKMDLDIGILNYHLKKLEKSGLSYSLVFNGNKLGKIWNIILLNSKENSYMEEFLFKSGNVSSIQKTVGNYNYNITLFSDSIEGLYDLISDLRESFANSINKIDILFNFDFYKYPKLPEIILKD